MDDGMSCVGEYEKGVGKRRQRRPRASHRYIPRCVGCETKIRM